MRALSLLVLVATLVAAAAPAIAAPGDAATFILTMSTSDGFEASDGLDEAQTGDLARSLENAPRRVPPTPVRN